MQEPVLYQGETRFRPDRVKGLEQALELLETVLGDSEFVAGSEPTIADCCCIASVSTIVVRESPTNENQPSKRHAIILSRAVHGGC